MSPVVPAESKTAVWSHLTETQMTRRKSCQHVCTRVSTCTYTS